MNLASALLLGPMELLQWLALIGPCWHGASQERPRLTAPPPSCSINSVLIPVGLNLKPKGSLSYHELLVLSVIFPVFSFHFC